MPNINITSATRDTPRLDTREVEPGHLPYGRILAFVFGGVVFLIAGATIGVFMHACGLLP